MNFKLLILLFSLTLISFVDSSFADQKQSQTSINRPAKEKSNEYVEKLSLFGINHVYTRLPNKFLRFYLHLKKDSNEEIVSDFSSFGWEAYKRNYYQEAVKWFYLCAEQGDVDTQYNLGLRFANGRGIPQDYNEAIRIWRLAAEQGNAQEKFDLVERYASGQGVPQSYKEAIKWLQSAPDNERHTQAKFLLDSILNNQAQKKHSKNRKDSQNILVITFPYYSLDGLEAYRKKTSRQRIIFGCS
jgi:hypothetical protein